MPTEGQPGLFLDLDGTLADSLPVLRGVYDRFLARFGHSGTAAGFAAVDGPVLSAIVEGLKRTHGLIPEVAELEDVYVGFIHDAYDAVPPAPGARALIGRARRAGWRIAVVTSGREDIAGRWLERSGLAADIDLLVGAGAVVRHKPDPEPYRHALAHTGCAAALSAAVEDSPRGIAAAHGAGLSVFAMRSPLHPDLDLPAGVRRVACLEQVEKALFDDRP